MPKYYVSHPTCDVVIDAQDKKHACRKVCWYYHLDKRKCEFVFVNELGFSSQFNTADAYNIKECMELEQWIPWDLYKTTII